MNPKFKINDIIKYKGNIYQITNISFNRNRLYI